MIAMRNLHTMNSIDPPRSNFFREIRQIKDIHRAYIRCVGKYTQKVYKEKDVGFFPRTHTRKTGKLREFSHTPKKTIKTAD